MVPIGLDSKTTPFFSVPPPPSRPSSQPVNQDKSSSFAKSVNFLSDDPQAPPAFWFTESQANNTFVQSSTRENTSASQHHMSVIGLSEGNGSLHSDNMISTDRRQPDWPVSSQNFINVGSKGKSIEMLHSANANGFFGQNLRLNQPLSSPTSLSTNMVLKPSILQPTLASQTHSEQSSRKRQDLNMFDPLG